MNRRRKAQSMSGKVSNLPRRRKVRLSVVGVTACVGILGFCLAWLFWSAGGTSPEKEKPPVVSQRAFSERTPTPPEPMPLSPEPTLPPPEPTPLPPEPTPLPPQPVSAVSAAMPAPQMTVEALKKEAIGVAQHLLKDISNGVDSLVLMGDVYWRQGNSAKAVKCWQEWKRD